MGKDWRLEVIKLNPKKEYLQDQKYFGMLPYRRLEGKLIEFDVVLEEGNEEIEISKELPKIKSKYLELNLIENRNNKKNITAVIHTSKNFHWGEQSYSLLKDIVRPLNDKTEYKWETIEELIVNFLKDTNKYKHYDYTLGILTGFIGEVFRAKFELTNQDFSELMEAEDIFIKDIRRNVFSRLKVFKELIRIDSTLLEKEEKGKEIIKSIIKNHHSHSLPNFAFYEPFYEANIEPLYRIERDELYAMERKFDNELKKIEDNNQGNAEMLRIKRAELFDTFYSKRIQAYENRRVLGGGLSFEKKEERKRKEAQLISYELINILASWTIHGSETKSKCISIFWDLFEDNAWERQLRETENEKLKNKWITDIKEIKKIQAGQWDSNTMTLLSVLFAIFASIFFGLPSIFNLGWLLSFLIASLFLVLYIVFFKMKKIRKFVIKHMTEILKGRN